MLNEREYLQSTGGAPVETALYAVGLNCCQGTLLSGLADGPPGPQISYLYFQAQIY